MRLQGFVILLVILALFVFICAGAWAQVPPPPPPTNMAPPPIPGDDDGDGTGDAPRYDSVETNISLWKGILLAQDPNDMILYGDVLTFVDPLDNKSCFDPYVRVDVDWGAWPQMAMSNCVLNCKEIANHTGQNISYTTAPWVAMNDRHVRRTYSFPSSDYHRGPWRFTFTYTLQDMGPWLPQNFTYYEDYIGCDPIITDAKTVAQQWPSFFYFDPADPNNDSVDFSVTIDGPDLPSSIVDGAYVALWAYPVTAYPPPFTSPGYTSDEIGLWMSTEGDGTYTYTFDGNYGTAGQLAKGFYAFQIELRWIGKEKNFHCWNYGVSYPSSMTPTWTSMGASVSYTLAQPLPYFYSTTCKIYALNADTGAQAAVVGAMAMYNMPSFATLTFTRGTGNYIFIAVPKGATETIDKGHIAQWGHAGGKTLAGT